MTNAEIEHSLPLKRRFGPAPDVLQYAQMNGAKNVVRPETKIPLWPNTESTPGTAEQCGGSIPIATEKKLAALGSEMADQFGILG